MKKKIFALTACVLCAAVFAVNVFGVAGHLLRIRNVEEAAYTSPSQTEGYEEGMIDVQELEDEYDAVIEKCFPMFDDETDYSRGGPTVEEMGEDYADYQAYTASRHEFEDMIGHESEVSAVRLVGLGVFDKTERFDPDGSMTVTELLRALLKLSGRASGTLTDSQVKNAVRKTNLFEKGIAVNYNATVTNEMLAYILGRAAVDAANAAQYAWMLDDYEEIQGAMKAQVLDAIALGLVEITDFALEPKSAATRAAVADGLYRLANPAARVIPLYDVGQNKMTGDVMLLKSSMEENASGMQFGFFPNYNKQASVVEKFGKLPVSRTDFYKWNLIETEKGVYNMPSFGNDLAAHKTGGTVINNIDISANKTWYSDLDDNHCTIPEFYTQVITDAETRSAAKAFLYEFVQAMLESIGGDVLLSIDYELDFKQALWNNEVGKNRARLFADWYVEACAVARQAAADIDAADRLKLIVIYNNVTPLHLAGVSENQWMLDIAEAVDCIGIDTYQFYEDKTDPSYTLQNIRFLMNNYSLGKPVYVVENGLGMSRVFPKTEEMEDWTESQVQAYYSERLPAYYETQAAYYTNLFREFRFALERGDFLNANLCGFLVWSYFDTSTSLDKISGIADSDNTLRQGGEAILSGVQSLYKQRQFAPSVLSSVSEVSDRNISIAVDSGTEYQKLTYLVKNFSSDDGTAGFLIKLQSAGTVMLTVNGEKHYVSESMKTSHTIKLTGMHEGLNVIDVYFGSAQTPFEQTVNEILLTGSEQSLWTAVTKAPQATNLIAGKTPTTIVNGNGAAVSDPTKTNGGSGTSLWTNGNIFETVKWLKMWNGNGMKITYQLDGYYDITHILLSSGDAENPHEVKWKAYVSDDPQTLFEAQNLVAYVKTESGNKALAQYATVNSVKCGNYVGILLMDNGIEENSNAFLSEIAVYGSQPVLGDADSSDEVDIADLAQIKQYLSGGSNKIHLYASDINKDGQITWDDFRQIKNLLLGI